MTDILEKMPEPIEEIFRPSKKEINEDEIFKGIEILKKNLDTNQLSVTFFTLILDSFKNQGAIGKLESKDLKEHEITEFKFL